MSRRKQTKPSRASEGEEEDNEGEEAPHGHMRPLGHVGPCGHHVGPLGHVEPLCHVGPLSHDVGPLGHHVGPLLHHPQQDPSQDSTSEDTQNTQATQDTLTPAVLPRHHSGEADEPYICPYCRAECASREQLEEHRVSCGRDPPVLPVPETHQAAFEDGDQPDELRLHQDVANNNQAHALKAREAPEHIAPDSRESSVDRNNDYDSDSNPVESGPLAQIKQLLAQSEATPQMGPIAQQLAQSNMALEAIQNTRMALAQFATSAMNSSNSNNPQAVQEFALLQGTLYTLQHQQMMQLQLIQQLQAQHSLKTKEGSSGLTNHSENEQKSATESLERPEPPTSPPQTPRPPPPPTTESTPIVSSSFISSLMERFKVPPASENNSERPPSRSSLFSSAASGPTPDLRDRPLSPPMTASSIASSVIQHLDPPPPDEPNTLEMLQRTANNVLNNASQGLLTNRLMDDQKPSDGKDPYYKHRCRYCGKVFGSDSGLQIHIRSHTGERPFKCNICGNRFTTKGNLKVHFQRHSTRFPHVKMNPHPVPEHLDKFHPPLLAQLGELKDYPSPPTGPPNPFNPLPSGPTLPPYRLPGPPPSLDLHRPFNLLNLARQSREDEPENLVLAEPRSPPEPIDRSFAEKLEAASRMDEEDIIRPSPFVPRKEKNEILDPRLNEVDMSEESLSNNSLVIKKEKNLDNEKEFEHKEYEEEKILEEEQVEVREKALDEESKYEAERRYEENNLSKQNTFEEEHPIADKSGIYESENKSEPERRFEDQRRSPKDIFPESQEIHSLHDEKSPEREHPAEQSPIDIRVRTDRELKDSEDNTSTKVEPDMDTNDSRPASSDQPTDLRMRPEFRPLGLPTIPFSGPRFPLNFPFLPGLPTSFHGPMGPPPSLPMRPGIDPSKDPSIYANLLPRPGSTDNSWEALIEVQKTSDTMKLEQLVNNIENKITDPNQCFICQRVLSCKSALQMHYRIHTGERPFKCKICGRSFTTKGNLKTHMSVHRAKPPMRMLHQCPVCHKKYTNGLVLQQHIRQHTGEPTDLSSEQIAAAEIRDFPPMHIPTSLSGMLPSGFPLPPHPLHGFPQLPLPLRYQLSPEAMRHRELFESEERNADEEKYLRSFSTSSRSSSTGSAEQRIAEDLTMRARENSFNGMTSPRVSVSPTPSDYSDNGDQSHDTTGGDNHISPIEHELGGSISPAVSTGSQEGGTPNSLDLVPRHHHPLYSPFGLFPPPLTTGPLTPPTHSFPGLNSLYLPNIPSRGSTTCQICFKTFACQSALEIHYRSHTKERPFKCTICDQGFSTKQHWLTHKIRDGCRNSQVSCKTNGTSNTSPLPSSIASPLPSSLASPLPSSLASPLPSSLPSPLHLSWSFPLPASITSPRPASLTSPLPCPLPSPLPSSLASPLPSPLASPLPASLPSPLPTSLPSPLPTMLPPAAVTAALLHQAREEEQIDSRLKREREGENILPVPKRPSGGSEEDGLACG